MSFITQGRTNWRFILIVFVLVLIVTGGILAYQNQWLSDNRVDTSNITTDCAKEGERVRGDGQSFPKICCSNLKPMYGSEKEDCGLPNVPGDIGTCSDCGDGICEQENNEKKCNCPQDCSEIKTTPE